MKIGGFRVRKPLMINWGGFTASLNIIIAAMFSRVVNCLGLRNWLLKKNRYEQPYGDTANLKLTA